MGKRSICSEFEWQRNVSKIAILKAVQLLIYFTLQINTWFGDRGKGSYNTSFCYCFIFLPENMEYLLSRTMALSCSWFTKMIVTDFSSKAWAFPVPTTHDI